MHPVSLQEPLVQLLYLLSLHVVFSAFLLDNVLLALVRLDQFIDLSDFLLAGVILILKFILLFLQLHYLHLQRILILSLTLQLHALVPKSLLQISEVVQVLASGLIRENLSGMVDSARSPKLLLLLQKHIFLHQCLLNLLSQSQAFVDVNSQFNFYFLGFRQFYVSLKLFNKLVLFLYLKFEIPVVLFKLADDE